MDDVDLGGLRAYAEEARGRYQQLRAGIVEMQQQLNAVTATAKSSDGYVTATVGPRGQLVKLQLDPRIYRNPDSAKLAQSITETIGQANADAAEQVAAVTKRFAPGMAAGTYLDGDLTARFERLETMRDEIMKGMTDG